MVVTWCASAFLRDTPVRLALFALIAALAPLPGAAEQISFGNATRTYELFRPARQAVAGQGVPLIVVLHETGNTGARIRRTLGLDAIAHREGFAVAYADALNGNWNDGRLGQSQGPQREQRGGDDVGFLSTLVEHLNARGLGSPGDTALVGVDGGGMMVYRFACESRGVFSSYVALLANMPVELRQKCQPAERKPMLIVAGTTDNIMPFGGGKLATTTGMVQSADTTFQYWGQVNGCAAGDVVTLPDLDKNDGTRVELIAAQDCFQDADTVYYRIVGGGHQLPTRSTTTRPIDRSGGKVSHDIDTADLIWQFASGRR
jgi:polyhydroxybutyrate depolymerase